MCTQTAATTRFQYGTTVCEKSLTELSKLLCVPIWCSEQTLLIFKGRVGSVAHTPSHPS